ncbi:hypothetical protein [Pandoraea sp. NPDC087047]|uniref:hypothetical protein n=1 Tax=Pandoraea sp. NPDC087047 TaxID=3364390 RepID=UPI00382A9DCE
MVIDIQEIKNQLHSPLTTSTDVKRPSEPFRNTAFECRPVPVSTYFDNVLAELITPQSDCAARQYASNAELRDALREMLTLHPQGREFSLKSHIESLSLPSLLHDEPDYLPGTLAALSLDIGAHAVKIGRIRFPEFEILGEAEFLFAGESELAFLHENNLHAPRIREDHASILAFHYRAAGMKGHTTLPPAGYVNAAQDETHLSDFTAQLARCRHRDNSGRVERDSKILMPRLSGANRNGANRRGTSCTLL